ncbi:tetratricopeptide repeat protein [Chitinivorax sp. B]|uniref:tetratricopeptide repeat protein n=1 Tax=Chitinivorax sp. B TaxID=2502235 RepID=UPI0010F7411E|nr:tetratricopeptide repeat protein [Chitinivorax sp. B]
MNVKLIHCATLLALLTGCAQLQQPVTDKTNPQTTKSAAQPEKEADEDDEVPVVMPAPSANLPKQALTNDILFNYLVGEVALQRGRGDVAASAFAELTKRTKDPRVARRGTEVAMQGGRMTQALENARTWIELEPESTNARSVLVGLLLGHSKYDDALPMVKAILAKQTVGLPRVWLELHDLLIKQQNKAGALQFAKTLATDYPFTAEARFTVGSLALRANEAQLAESEIKQALALRPEWEHAALYYAQLLHKTSVDAAKDFLADYLHKQPNALEARRTYARILAAKKDWTTARDEFNRIVEREPKNVDMLFAVASISLELKEPGVALDTLKKIEEIGVREPASLYLMMGQVYEDLGRAEEARQAYALVPMGDRYATAQARYSKLLVADGRLEEAIKHLSDRPHKSVDQQVSWIQMQVQLMREARMFERAYGLLTDSLRKYPTNVDLLYDRAMIAEKLDRVEQAEKDLRAVLKVKPESAMVLNALGFTLADRTKRYEEALKLIESALKLEPEDPFILDSMGWVKFRMGKLEEGLTYLNKAYSVRPDPEIAAHIGEVQWAMGRRQDAKNTWNDALKQNPDHDALLQVIKKFGL